MINEEFKIEKKEAQEYEPLPENVYQVELLDIEVQEKLKYQSKDEYEKVFSFQFTLLAGRDRKGESLRGRNIWRNYVPTYLFISQKNGKNALYQIIEAIIGHDMTPEDEATMDTAFLNKLIGQQCRVLVKNTTKDNKTYSNIENFLPIEMQAPRLNAEEKEKATVKKEDKPQVTVQTANGEMPVNGEVIDTRKIDFNS